MYYATQEQMGSFHVGVSVVQAGTANPKYPSGYYTRLQASVDLNLKGKELVDLLTEFATAIGSTLDDIEVELDGDDSGAYSYLALEREATPAEIKAYQDKERETAEQTAARDKFLLEQIRLRSPELFYQSVSSLIEEHPA